MSGVGGEKKSAKTVKRSKAGDGLRAALLSPLLLEAVPDAIVAVDHHGTILQTNRQAEELFGYKSADLIGQNVEILVPERYRGQHLQHRTRFAGQPNTRRMGAGIDLYGRRRDGTEFPVEISLGPVETPEGPIVLSAIRDISDRKRIEDELRRAHAELGARTDRELWEHRSRMAAIVDASEDAIIGKDLDGVVTAWNKGAERMYGYTAEEMVGHAMQRIVPPDRPEEIPSIMARVREGESIEHYESIRVTKDGRHLNVSISVSPIRNQEGKIVGASAIGRNITGQKRVEDQLRQAQKMEAVGRLAGGVAHDFNNILGIITACTELLRDRVDGSSGAVTYVDNIRKAAERGASLTRQLLAFSRKQVVQPRLIDLNERIREISKLLRPLMGDDVDIVISAKSNSAVVEIDPSQVDQVVMNLAVNARDAMPHGGKLMLEIGSVVFDKHFAQQHPTMTPGRYVLLAVSDTGIGMDEATVTRVFEPFFTTKETGKGTGLGLATVYGIVRQSGGNIWVYSEPGRGSTFKIYLPAADEKLGLSGPAPEAELSLPQRPGTTILLVEDDDMMRSLTRQMLEEHGYTVLEAGDGKAALEAAGSNGRIDLVLTDVVMKGVSGPELTSKLRTLNPELKVIFMSGYTGELISSSTELPRDVPLLAKPFTRRDLLGTIHAVLE